ncbi:MAG TPA: addiction module protein [Thermoanaerobaculia bacterium]|nr:addiction module protein [Thermoanaerobaculia bacterium]
MRDTHQDLLKQVLLLPLEERAEFASEVLASLDGESDPGAEAAWAVELERRANRVLSGESQGEDWDEVRTRITREVLGQ